MDEFMLAPDEDLAHQALIDNLNSVHSINVGALAIEALNYPYPGTTTPSWYEDVNGQLTTAKTNAIDWIDNLVPSLFSSVPQGVIDLGNFISTAIPSLKVLVEKLASQSTKTQALSDIVAIMDEIETRCDVLKSSLTSLNTDFSTFVSQLKTDRDNLVSAVSDAEAQIDFDEDALRQLNSQLTALQVQLSQDSDEESTSSVGTATATFGAVVSLVGIAATGGFGSIISFAVGIVKIGIDIAEYVQSNEAIQADITAIYDLMKDVNDDTYQVAAMRSLITSINTVLYQNVVIQNALPGMIALIENVSISASGVSTALSMPEIDETLISDLQNLDEALHVWTSLAGLAEQVELSILNKSDVQLNQDN
jgi:hypothetical protein